MRRAGTRSGGLASSSPAATSASRTRRTGEIFLVAITHRVEEVPEADRVELEFSNGTRHPRTGLEGESAAHCGWQVMVTRHHISERRGAAPPIKMAAILRRLKELGALL